VSVDTSVAHLAGALGKPVYILLHANNDWRWLLNRSDSVWYPSAKLYRQENMFEWDGVLASLRADIEGHFVGAS
jgi:ADP-heptose:LPS heptosyltransferase